MFGLDVASVDHDTIDWVAVSQGGRTFAVARACFGMDPDEAFPTYWAAMKDAGLVRGAYLFCRPTAFDMTAQVDQFLQIVGPLGPGDLPPVLDLEDYAHDPWDPAAILEGMRQGIDLVKKRIGVPPIIYTSRRVWGERLGNPQGSRFSECPLWVADYRAANFRNPALPDEWGEGNYWIHQYAGDTKNVPGVRGAVDPAKGQVDLDRFNPLHAGEKGLRSAWLNERLGLSAGGTFTSDTVQAVKQFQLDRGLECDGIVGPRTWSHLVWV